MLRLRSGLQNNHSTRPFGGGGRHGPFQEPLHRPFRGSLLDGRSLQEQLAANCVVIQPRNKLHHLCSRRAHLRPLHGGMETSSTACRPRRVVQIKGHALCCADNGGAPGAQRGQKLDPSLHTASEIGSKSRAAGRKVLWAAGKLRGCTRWDDGAQYKVLSRCLLCRVLIDCVCLLC